MMQLSSNSISLSADDSVPRRWVWLAAIALAVAVGIAYSNAYSIPFLFDDAGSITDNPTLRHWRSVLMPPGGAGETVGGRPLLNLTFALNYAIGGASVWGYHLVNIVVHLCAGLVLFGLVRRTFVLCKWGGSEAYWGALAAATFWLLHPLQTESVTYIVQRAESLMALMYLLTLYCFARAVFGAEKRWLVLSVVFCSAGMAAKEVMVSAPLLVLLYDRAFVSGSFSTAFNRRRKYYVALAAAWLVLAACLSISGFRGGTAGFDTPMTWWMYALRQCEGMVIYLKLVFWPAPLVFDYGVSYVTDFWSVWPQATFVVLLGCVALWALFARPRVGFLGALFFAVILPSSSVLPVVSQTLAEHRMYLPLAGVVVFVVVAARYALRGRHVHVQIRTFALGGAVIAVALGLATWRRNQVMQSAESIWRDTVAKVPANHRAQNNLGFALADAKRYAESIPFYLEAVRLKPDYGEAYNNIAYGYSTMQRHAEAIPFYERAIFFMKKIGVGNLDRVYLNMGISLRELGRDKEACYAFEEAVRINSRNAFALNNLGNYEYFLGRHAEAKTYYMRAVEADPEFAEAWYDLGNAVVALREPLATAEMHYRRAIELAPELIQAQSNLGRLLLAMSRPAEAAPFLENAAREKPSSSAHLYAARAAMLNGKYSDAISHLEKVLQEAPSNTEAHNLLASARAALSAAK